MVTHTATTPRQPHPDDTLLVLVASDEPSRLERARAVVTFVPDVRVTEALSATSVVRLVTSLYEQPVGCPDVLLLDEAMLGAREAAAWLRDSCPGVRILPFSADAPHEALDAALREQLEAVVLAAR